MDGCVIAAGAASCPASIGWTTMNAAAPRLVVAGATVSTAPTGRLNVPVGTSALTVALFDGDRALDEETVRGACVSASAWDGVQCRAYAERLDELAARR